MLTVPVSRDLIALVAAAVFGAAAGCKFYAAYPMSPSTGVLHWFAQNSRHFGAMVRQIEDEIGDILFVMANIARRWGVSPEEALRKSTRKFQRRFEAIEVGLATDGRMIGDATLVEMEEHYQAAKRRES